ncbi:MAG TPA: serine/threonine-protein kinase [Planctomycetaceae bacterium]|nr:serine/threonine-protein kinase [Planctomycetaceae bacterium]
MLKARQKLGKYRIERRLASGGFGSVFQAMDTIEGIRVALKIPHAAVITESVLDDFRKEVRMTARLEHTNILPLKNASFIDGHFVIATPLGEESLADRLRRRMSLTTALELFTQMLEAVAYAHRQRIIHCDIKPENFILFPGGRVRLTDFGIAKVAQKTVAASGSGTVGYMAPEQAMGRPSLRSDVFALGLILYRMLTGVLPDWPYRWPPTGHQKLRRRVHPEMIAFLRRALDMHPRKRFRDADQMLRPFRLAKSKTLRRAAAQRRRSSENGYRT